MGIVLFIVSILLTLPLFIINVIIAPFIDVILFKWKTGVKNLNNWFLSLAVSVDQFGNASCSRLFNLIMIKKNGFKFGNMDQTVSFVLGVNQINGQLRVFGKVIVKILDLIEKDHCYKAFRNQEKNDKEAVNRINNNFYNV